MAFDIFRDLEDTEWLLDSVRGGAVITDVDRSRPPVIRFAAAGAFSGNTGCNNFFGTFRVEGSTVSAGPVGVTMMMCPESTMEQERAVLEAIESTRALAVVGGELVLTDVEGATVLTARREAP